VNTADVATPLALVVAVFTPPANVPLAPVVGAVNVTTTPPIGVAPSVTVATRGAANGKLVGELCADPLVSAIDSLGEPEFEPQAVQKASARQVKVRMPA
jgi:hypothetical protein